MIAVAIASVCGAQAQSPAAKSLSDVRGKYSEIVANPQLAQSEMASLALADQLKFVAEINKSIDKMPGKTGTQTCSLALCAFLTAFHASSQLSTVLASWRQERAQCFRCWPKFLLRSRLMRLRF